MERESGSDFYFAKVYVRKTKIYKIGDDISYHISKTKKAERADGQAEECEATIHSGKKIEFVCRMNDAIRPKHTILNKSFSRKHNQKSPNYPSRLPGFSSATQSVEQISAYAAAFSQGQLSYFECLLNEFQVANMSASEAEDITRKWLSRMTIDCNRYCTIMNLIHNGDFTSPNKSSKEKRIIKFPDEVGGKLCDIKKFDVGMDSFLPPKKLPLSKSTKGQNQNKKMAGAPIQRRLYVSRRQHSLKGQNTLKRDY